MDPRAPRNRLGLLEMTADDRARAIGQIYSLWEGSNFAELLIDLETDPTFRRLLAVELRSALRGRLFE
jgi:hypothetical protein